MRYNEAHNEAMNKGATYVEEFIARFSRGSRIYFRRSLIRAWHRIKVLAEEKV